MPDIFSEEWLGSWADVINSDEDLAKRAPDGLWRIYIVINGDGNSPYIPQGEKLQLMFHLEDGRCVLLESVDEPPGPRDLDFRFTGSAAVFEEIAVGLRDPVESGLDGSIEIAGDMRFLLRYAELVTQVMELYTNKLATDWPHGKPPYGEGDGPTPD